MLLPIPTSLVSYAQCRALHTSASLLGKRNFRKFLLGPKAGTLAFKNERAKEVSFRKKFPDIDIPDYGTRPTGAHRLGDSTFITVPEMIPELVVPDLTDFNLKPYVSYRCPEVVQEEFTARDLFNAVYSDKITADFERGALTEGGQPREPSAEESLTAESARQRARGVHSDIWEK
ncbi:39S ribosomal protein L41, mitochondrial-like [Amphibalanus amphitrite]|uniref:39S ribosomal protein L41, mitochondrial-like n=1 Tax=Amphibalanus amphitrite TaxID=1232801 RepID=UPI001C911AF4|nr:39S ribosomal protein L41, mitochondrial-like [Amphibalanus amphitrite]XP_043227868.1 39S ribosomal protein L41, mitochondrial-like [Amphibalanus amphitrite]XP_043227869.1 39S ribosomal protein L41, mitochondrial-like [Amphibalanus amphitrite]XP_043227870.1 39S ribosomal protein L41, mitochondrial-like [Amphibalanus amphitrite]